MSDQAFSTEDSEFSRRDRFKARRQLIETMIQMGVQPKNTVFETPRGAIKANALKALGKKLLAGSENADD
jgi:hypothetical protein